MDPVLLGNLFSVFATAADLSSTAFKSTKRMLWAQSVSQGFLALSSLTLGGYSAVVQNVVSVVRNLTAIRQKASKALEYVLIALGVVLGIVFNNLHLIGWLPIIANLEYSVAVFRFKNNERMLKAAFAVCIILYTVFNIAIQNYVGAVSNTAVLVATVIAIIKSVKQP